jgi:uncharacterized cupredoxin-like copper-binding protein
MGKRRGWLIAVVVGALVLLVGSVSATVAWGGVFGQVGTSAGTALARSGSGSGSPCPTPSLAAPVVTVSLTNMGGPMMGSRGGMFGGGMFGGGMFGGGTSRGAMALRTDRTTVPGGSVSFLVTNNGSITHELVILPLSGNQTADSRAIGADSRVDEAGSVGEASNNCGEGAGKGIRAGSSGWVTLDLAPGRYELVCNLPGHYAAGMYTELTVS